MPPDWLPNNVLLGYTQGKLHCGHHPKRWIEDILSHLNLNLERAMRTAQDRIHWCKDVECEVPVVLLLILYSCLWTTQILPL